MRAALQQLSSMKDEEIAATKKGWENKVQGLMQQVIIIVILDLIFDRY